ncbi:MAG: hypothetical protein R3C62_01620 [Chloroflexota bacterium]
MWKRWGDWRGVGGKTAVFWGDLTAVRTLFSPNAIYLRHSPKVNYFTLF